MHIKTQPSLVDKNLFRKPPVIIHKSLPLSFYFNIILILCLIIGICLLYHKYNIKNTNDLILQQRLISLNERINEQLKNIE
jgi:hypothetical protein